MFDLNAWLNETVTVQDEHQEPKQVTRLERVCFLLFANGGSFNVSSWGIISTLNGHQIGLEQDQALDLLFYSGVFEGLHLAGVDFMSTLKPKFDEYIKRFTPTAG